MRHPLSRRYHFLLYALTLLCGTVTIASAQGLLSVYNVNATAFPTIRAKFVALDAAGNQLRGLNPGDFSITENGIPRTVTSVSCPPQKPVDPLSVGVMVDTYRYLDLAEAGTKRFIELLKMPPSELGITTMDQGVFIVQDLTMDRAKATAATTRLISSPGTHLQRIFYDPNAGGVPFISGRPPRKVLVLLTDLHCPVFDLDTTRLWADAARENISVYMVLFNANDYEGLFNRIAVKTGGKVFEQVTTKEEVEQVFEEIAVKMQYEACEVNWKSGNGCNAIRSTDISIEAFRLKHTIEYLAPISANAQISINLPTIHFKGVPLGMARDTTIYIKANGLPFTVENIISNNPNFAIISPQIPFSLQPEQLQKIVVRFTPIDSGFTVGKFDIQTFPCSTIPLYVSGGYPGISPRVSQLKVISPNGGEYLQADSTFVIRWEGIRPNDSVRIEYTIDAGSSWNEIANNVTGLEYKWSVPFTISNRCLIRVTQVQKGIPKNTSNILLNGHTGPVLDVIFSPDGKLAVTTSADSTARIWDAQTGKLLHILSGHKNFVVRAKFNHSGNQVVTSSWDNTAKVWDVYTGNLLFTLQHSNIRNITYAEFSPDDKYIVTSGDRNPSLWNALTGKHVRWYSGQIEEYSNAGTFSHDGTKIIVAGGRDNLARIWDTETGILLRTIPDKEADMYVAQFSPDGLRALTVSEYKAYLWDVVTGRRISTLDAYNSSASYGEFSSDGSKALTIGMGGRTNITNGITGQTITTIAAATSGGGKGFSAYYIRAKFNLDASLVATITGDSIASIWFTATGFFRQRLIGHSNFLYAINFSPDGWHIGTASEDSTARIWDISEVVVQQDISDSLWSIVAPKVTVSIKDVDMQSVLIGKERDSLIIAAMCNNESVPVHILGIDATNGDIDDFMIMSGGGDFTLAPGECRDIAFAFMPMDAGYRDARFTIRTPTDTLRDIIHVFGSGVVQQLSIVTDVIDFGQTNVGTMHDTSVTVILRNDGNAPITLTGISQRGPDTEQFSIIAGNTALTLAPRETYPLSLRFRPDRVGKTSGRIVFDYEGIGSPATAALFGEGIAAELLSTAPSIWYDTLFCESSHDTTIEIYNSGNADLVISDVTLSGINANEFLLYWISQGKQWTVISRGEHATVVVRFMPKSLGEKHAALLLETNALNATAGVMKIPLYGRKDSVGLQLSKSSVQLNNVPVSAIAYDTLSLRNTGTLPLIWKAPFIIGKFTIESITPTITSAGGTSDIVIRFDGGEEGAAFEGAFSFNDSYCSLPHLLALHADVQFTASATLALPDITAAAGDLVEIPVLLRKPRFVVESHATAFNTSLRYNATLLAPVDPTPQGSIIDGERIIPLSVPVSTEDTLITLRFRAALGNDSTTALRLEHSEAVGGSVTLSEQAGQFTLSGICRDGGTRLVNGDGAIVLKSVRPNPTNDRAEIEYEVTEQGRTQLYITDMLGRRVATLVDGEVAPGRYIIQWNPAEQASGMFFCTLQTPTEIRVENIEVQK